MFNIFSRKLKAKPDPKSEPGTRVYHEYFVGSEPFHDGYHWMARVYWRDGRLFAETTGAAKADRAARKAALAWADAAKAEARNTP